MSGRIVAVYNSKGGVGKTTLAVNLAWASAALSSRRTMIWDLDPQVSASYILSHGRAGADLRKRIVENEDLSSFLKHSSYDRLDVLSADPSLRHLDRDFHELGKRRRLAKVAAAMAFDYDRVIIDCPPGLTDTSDQILRAADLVVVPLIPAVLSQRALDGLKEHLAQKNAPKVVLAPVFSMVDRRRQLHRRELEQHPEWPVIPMASSYERMTESRAPIGELMPAAAPPVQAVRDLWRRIERTLTKT